MTTNVTTSRKPVSIKLTADTQAAIDAAASAANLSRSAWIKQAIEAALAGVTTGMTTGAATIYATADELAAVAARVTELERQQIHPMGAGDDGQSRQGSTGNNGAHSPEVVAHVIAWTVEGLKPGQIAERLNADGFKPAKAKAFNATNVTGILNSPTHAAARKAAGLQR